MAPTLMCESHSDDWEDHYGNISSRKESGNIFEDVSGVIDPKSLRI